MHTQLYIKPVLFALILIIAQAAIAQQVSSVSWPEGKRLALSLTFDDGRNSQVEKGIDLLNQYQVKATFYVMPSSVEQRLDGWKKAVASGHEIGNHSLLHPCSGNFLWSREKALEDYTLEKMRHELTEANRKIQALLGVTPQVFAYPCGQTFVGRGTHTKSYVPLVAELFLSGRLWLSEAPNDPTYCDMAQLTGIEMDGKSFEQIRPVLEKARQTGQWVVLAGHEMGEAGDQTTRLAMLKELIAYAQNPANGIWLAPVGTVTKHILSQKK